MECWEAAEVHVIGSLPKEATCKESQVQNHEQGLAVEQKMEADMLYFQKLGIKPGGVTLCETFRELQMFRCDYHN